MMKLKIFDRTHRKDILTRLCPVTSQGEESGVERG